MNRRCNEISLDEGALMAALTEAGADTGADRFLTD